MNLLPGSLRNPDTSEPNYVDLTAQILFEESESLRTAQRFPEAMAKLKTILALKPYPVAWVHAGIIAREMENDQASLVFLAQAEKAAPRSSIVLHNLAQTYRNLGRFQEASQCAERALIHKQDDTEDSDPKNDLPLHAAELALIQGKLTLGWHKYAHRLIPVKKNPLDFAPVWNGQPLTADEKLLIWYEQGIGEEIMFASCYADAIQRAPNTTIMARKKLIPALKRSFPTAEVVNNFDMAKMQFHIPAGSLPTIFRQTFDDFPRRNQHLHPDWQLVSAFRAENATPNLRVGLAWGNPRSKVAASKSTPLAEVAKIAATPGCEFQSVQYGVKEHEVDQLPEVKFMDFDPQFDFDRHLAHIASLDLVITNSGAAAHAAGALGVPCWVILPSGRGLLWHWFTERVDSPWYQSVTLFRCGAGGWGEAVDRVVGSLAELSRLHAARHPCRV